MCEKFAAEGSNVVVNYVTSQDKAEELVTKFESAYGVKSTAIKAASNTGFPRKERCHQALTLLIKNIGIIEDCIYLIEKSVQELGGLDIIVNNAGWTRFTAFGDLNALSHEEWDKVSINSDMLMAPLSLTLPVLAHQCHVPFGAYAASCSDTQRKRRWWGVSHYFFSGGKIAESHSIWLTCKGNRVRWQQHGLLSHQSCWSASSEMFSVHSRSEDQSQRYSTRASAHGMGGSISSFTFKRLCVLMIVKGLQFGEEHVQDIRDRAVLKQEVRSLETRFPNRAMLTISTDQTRRLCGRLCLHREELLYHGTRDYCRYGSLCIIVTGSC